MSRLDTLTSGETTGLSASSPASFPVVGLLLAGWVLLGAPRAGLSATQSRATWSPGSARLRGADYSDQVNHCLTLPGVPADRAGADVGHAAVAAWYRWGW